MILKKLKQGRALFAEQQGKRQRSKSLRSVDVKNENHDISSMPTSDLAASAVASDDEFGIGSDNEEGSESGKRGDGYQSYESRGSYESEGDEADGHEHVEVGVNCRQMEQSELEKSKALLMNGCTTRAEERKYACQVPPIASNSWQKPWKKLGRFLEQDKRDIIAQIQKSTVGTSVLEKGRAAQLRRGLEPKDTVVMVGRIAKQAQSTRPRKKDLKALIPQIELSARQQLLNLRSKMATREYVSHPEQDSRPRGSNGTTRKARKSQRFCHNKVKDNRSK